MFTLYTKIPFQYGYGLRVVTCPGSFFHCFLQII